jgi:hypothetical protein
VRAPGDRLDDRALELRLRILAVVDEIKPVRDDAGFERFAVASSERGSELAFVGPG